MVPITFYKTFNSFTENDLVEFTSKFNIELPEDYVDFLRTFNGGFLPQPNFVPCITLGSDVILSMVSIL